MKYIFLIILFSASFGLKSYSQNRTKVPTRKGDTVSAQRLGHSVGSALKQTYVEFKEFYVKAYKAGKKSVPQMKKNWQDYKAKMRRDWQKHQSKK